MKKSVKLAAASSAFILSLIFAGCPAKNSKTPAQVPQVNIQTETKTVEETKTTEETKTEAAKTTEVKENKTQVTDKKTETKKTETPKTGAKEFTYDNSQTSDTAKKGEKAVKDTAEKGEKAVSDTEKKGEKAVDDTVKAAEKKIDSTASSSKVDSIGDDAESMMSNMGGGLLDF